MISRMRVPLVGGLVLALLFSAGVSAETKLPAKRDFHVYLLVVGWFLVSAFRFEGRSGE